MEEKNIVINGFKASGIWTFNPTALNYDVLKKCKNKKESSDQQDNSKDAT